MVSGAVCAGVSWLTELDHSCAEANKLFATSLNRLSVSSRRSAARLSLSVKTVEFHKANGMRKMGMKSRVDIVRYAMLQGWL